MINFKNFYISEKTSLLISIIIVCLSGKNIYLDILSALFVINQTRYVYSNRSRKIIQIIFIITSFLSFYNSRYFLLGLYLLVVFICNNSVFYFFERNRRLSVKNSLFNKFSNLFSFRFKWNYINLRKDWINSSNLVLSIITFQLYACHFTLDYIFFFILFVLLLTLILYKIVNLSSIVNINLNRNFLKKLIRINHFVSLQDYWIVIRGTLVTIVILYLSTEIKLIEVVLILVSGIAIAIVLKVLTFLVLMAKGKRLNQKI